VDQKRADRSGVESWFFVQEARRDVRAFLLRGADDGPAGARWDSEILLRSVVDTALFCRQRGPRSDSVLTVSKTQSPLTPGIMATSDAYIPVAFVSKFDGGTARKTRQLRGRGMPPHSCLAAIHRHTFGGCWRPVDGL